VYWDGVAVEGARDLGEDQVVDGKKHPQTMEKRA
jgi:hypothetical protein